MRYELASIRKQATRAALWRLLDMVGGQTILFVGFTILARLLAPEDYGVVTLATAIIAVPSVILTEGLGTALVQRNTITDDHITTALWANLGMSFVFVALMQTGAGWAAQIAGMPLLEPVLRCLSALLIANAVTAIPAALYIRRLTYSTLAKRTFIATSGGSVVAVVMALLGFEIWSLVAMQLCTAALSSFFMWKELGWRPKLTFSRDKLRDLSHFTGRAVAGNGLRSLAGQVPVVIIGLLLDAKSLGYYYLIERVVATASMAAIAPVDSIMLPVLSRMQDDPARRAETYCKIIGIHATLWIPCLSALGILAPSVLPLLFGHTWDDAIPMLMIIAPLVAVSWPLTWSAGNILLAAGQAGASAWLRFMHLLINAVCFLVGVRFGTIGVACAYAAVQAFMVPISLWMVKNAAGVAPVQSIKAYLPALAAGIVMVVGLFGVSATVLPGVLTAVLEISSGIVVYVAAYYTLSPSTVNEYVATALQALR